MDTYQIDMHITINSANDTNVEVCSFIIERNTHKISYKVTYSSYIGTETFAQYQIKIYFQMYL